MIPIWLGIIIIAIIIEVVTIDLVSIWFATGAIIALITCLLGISQTDCTIYYYYNSLCYNS